MVLDEKTIQEIARNLLEAEKNRKAINPITDKHPNIAIEDAYKVQLEVVNFKKQEGQLVAGKKIGLTSKQMQDLLGINEPDYGHILDRMVISEDHPLSFSQLIQPRVEGEIAFILKKDLKGPGITMADVLNATKSVMASIEVIDSRIEDWKIKIQDTIADNASSARIILGSKIVSPHKLDLRYIGMVLEKNGEIVATGAGAAVMGNPAQSVAWLANKLSEFGISLKAGEIVMSGSLTAAAKVLPNDVITVTFDRLGAVTAKFTAQASP